MDITLIKTFIEVANTGSFVAASERLFVTQSAVSLRVQRLEDSLGHPLFKRSKAGAVLTSEGEQFTSYALSLLKIWEEARQQIAIPEGYSRSFSFGAQHALWHKLGFRWIDAMQAMMPELSIHAEMGMSDRLTRFLVEGVIQAALLYTPQLRPGLRVEPVLEEELILVASFETDVKDLGKEYVAVDWGPEFTHMHASALPHLTNSGRSLALGGLAADYIVNRRAAAYLPARAVQRYLDVGKLHVVANSPRFAYPAWVVWREDLDPEMLSIARRSLMDLAQAAENQQNILIESLDNAPDTP
ncbi:LysR family transcriptional regulator [Sulfitobacter sp. M39]|jgi:DNA-binding transcriptional LysR family regulator|uniref:LysR family transcriptional regulator n=1 Tax=Sulfitobacter sp. M39 TaxID=2675334 RepID=UPI001F01B6E5|nr:LysR family transcriptional regulator [Sulfitobacter sp. M39]MCF7746611.1 LysR family transcriptional regulator [Sulfitobacter sp. M39]